VRAYPNDCKTLFQYIGAGWYPLAEVVMTSAGRVGPTILTTHGVDLERLGSMNEELYEYELLSHHVHSKTLSSWERGRQLPNVFDLDLWALPFLYTNNYSSLLC
jgi:hypothetical protein